MSRRRLHLVIALLLPFMALRGFLPAGYMPRAEGGELRIVMCSAGLALPAGGGHDDGDRRLPGHGTDCPFALAQAGGIAPPSPHGLVQVAPPRIIRLQSLTTDSLPPATGPPRRATVRGPPALS
jgi:hypothetical protein